MIKKQEKQIESEKKIIEMSLEFESETSAYLSLTKINREIES
jgi:hypothetical protein